MSVLTGVYILDWQATSLCDSSDLVDQVVSEFTASLGPIKLILAGGTRLTTDTAWPLTAGPTILSERLTCSGSV